MNFICPKCKSESIQKFSVIYESGLSKIDGTSSGSVTVYGNDGSSVGSSSSTIDGKSQTMASKRTAPPSKEGYILPLAGFFVIFIVALIISSIFFWSFVEYIIFFLWIAISVLWCVFAYQHNHTIYPAEKAIWDRSFMCNRCHATFELPID